VAVAQTHLKVLTATLNLESHNLAIEVQNQSSKVVTAYDLVIMQFDAAGKPIDGHNDSVGVDLLTYGPAPASSWREIQPGEIAEFPVRAVPLPDAVSARATVVDVVYADCTFEGDRAKSVFIGRANDAKEARAAVALLTPYPATSEGFEAALLKLRDAPHGIGLSVLAKRLNLSGETAGRLFDKKQQVPSIAIPAADEWGGIVAELDERAAFLESESRAVRQ